MEAVPYPKRWLNMPPLTRDQEISPGIPGSQELGECHGRNYPIAFPPLTLVAVRYLISGTLTLAFAWNRGLHIPRGRELVAACIAGLGTLTIGNGALVISETLIPSGMAGLIVAMSPFWMVGVEALLPGGESLHAPTIGAMALGLGGAALLVTPGGGPPYAGHSLLIGFFVLQIGMAGWSFGSIYQRRNAGKAHPVVAGGIHQLAAALGIAPFAWLVPHQPIHWSTRGVSAILYLVVFGSLVGYSAFVYVMDRLPVAVVSIYPYVNAVVAVALGWLFYREPFGLRESAAMVVIFGSVALVKRYSRPVAG